MAPTGKKVGVFEYFFEYFFGFLNARKRRESSHDTSPAKEIIKRKCVEIIQIILTNLDR